MMSRVAGRKTATSAIMAPGIPEGGVLVTAPR